MSLSYYVKMPEGDSSTKPEIYFPSENYVLEGKISDDSTGLYLKIDNVNVEFWNLFGERGQERRFRHQGVSRDGQILYIELSDYNKGETKYEFTTRIDSEKPTLEIENIDSLNADSNLVVKANDEHLREHKALVNGKTEYKPGEFKGIGEELEYPSGTTFKLKTYLETETPGTKTFTVEISRGNLKVEKEFTIKVLEIEKPAPISPVDPKPNETVVNWYQRPAIHYGKPAEVTGKATAHTTPVVKVEDNKSDLTKELKNTLFKDVSDIIGQKMR